MLINTKPTTVFVEQQVNKNLENAIFDLLFNPIIAGSGSVKERAKRRAELKQEATNFEVKEALTFNLALRNITKRFTINFL